MQTETSLRKSIIKILVKEFLRKCIAIKIMVVFRLSYTFFMVFIYRIKRYSSILRLSYYGRDFPNVYNSVSMEYAFLNFIFKIIQGFGESTHV